MTFTNLASNGAEPFSMDKLIETLQKLDALPPLPLLLSSVHYPSDKAIEAKGKRDKVIAAHPSFWRRAEIEVRRYSEVDISDLKGGTLRPWMGVPVHEVDSLDDDSEAVAEFKHELRVRFSEALCEAAGVDHDQFGFKAMAKFKMGPLDPSNQAAKSPSR